MSTSTDPLTESSVQRLRFTGDTLTAALTAAAKWLSEHEDDLAVDVAGRRPESGPNEVVLYVRPRARKRHAGWMGD